MTCNLSKLERNLLIIILFIIVFVIVKLMDVEKQSNRDDKYYKQDTLINTIVIFRFILNSYFKYLFCTIT